MTDKRLEGLDLNLLLALHWLLTERSVTAAAANIGLSQPAMSRALARLRENFSDPLLVKSGAGMTPTPLAEQMQPALALAIERCRDVLRQAEQFDPARSEGVYRIACVDYVGAMAAAAWQEAIRPNAPGLDLEIENVTIASARDLVSGKIDLVFIPDPATLDLPPSVDIDQFVRKRILSEGCLVAVRNNHPLTREPVTLERYLSFEHVTIITEGKERSPVSIALSAGAHERRVAYKAFSFLLARDIVERTDCVLTAPALLLRYHAGGLSLFDPPLPIAHTDLYAGWHPNWTHDARHQWVRARLFDHIAARRCP